MTFFTPSSFSFNGGFRAGKEFDPTDLPGTHLLFDSTDDANIVEVADEISDWTDSLSSILHSTAIGARKPNLATVNGMQVTEWAINNFLEGDSTADALLNGKNGFTIISISNTTNNTTGAGSSIYYSTGTANSLFRAITKRIGTNTMIGLRREDADSLDQFLGDATLVKRGYLTNDQWHCFGGSVDAVNQNATMFLGAYKVGEETGTFGTGGTIEATNSLETYVGAERSINNWDGFHRLIYVRDQPSTDQEVEAIMHWMNNQVLVETTHQRQIVLSGDSIYETATIAASGFKDSMHYQIHQGLSDASTTYLVHRAVGGFTIEDVNDNLATVIGDVDWKASAKHVIIIGAGSNDMATDGVTAAVAITRMTDLIVDLRALRPELKIVVPNVIRRTEDATLNATIDEYNSLLAAGQATIDWDAIADVAALPETSDTTDTNNYSDGVHPTALLTALMADIVAASVATV